MPSKSSIPNLWLHRVAVLLAGATFPLLWVGGLVTTTQAGMAVPDWPGTYGYNLFLYPLATWILGPWDVFVEHGHRLFAAAVGMLTIVLAVLAWRLEDRLWVRFLTANALALVIFQGVLGGLRVVWVDSSLAMVHGCVGPLFFAVTVALAVVTSEDWVTAERTQADSVAGGRLHRLVWLTLALTYVQLVLGAWIRHFPVGAPPIQFQIGLTFHLLVAAGLLVHILLVAWQVWRSHGSEPLLTWPAAWLAALIVVQLGLGSATWIVKYGWPPFLGDWAPEGYTIVARSFAQTTIVTAHMATGSLILAQIVRLGLWTARTVPLLGAAAANDDSGSDSSPSDLQFSAWPAGGAA